MLEIMKAVNDSYSAVLSLISSVIMVIVTIIYVCHTKRQAQYAKESTELLSKQIKVEKQPCIIPEVVDSYGSAFDATDYTRIQLLFEIAMRNVGDAPAINVFVIGEIETPLSKEPDASQKQLYASLLPAFIQAIEPGKSQKIDICFETSEVNALVHNLRKAMNMNWERIKNDSSHHPYAGANLIIRVLYRNIMGQWNESVLSREVAWLSYMDPPPQKTHNLNENTIPPKSICANDKFHAVLIAPRFAPFTYRMCSHEYVNEIIHQFGEDCPEVLTACDFAESTD